MIRVQIMYPNTPAARFDVAYYQKTHIPLAKKLLKPISVTLDKGFAGGAPGVPAPFIMIAAMVFETLEDFQTLFAAAADELLGDIPKYTDVQPTIQISSVLE